MAELTADDLPEPEQVQEFIKQVRMVEAKYAWLGAAAAAATSALVGYVVAERRFRREYEARAEGEISEMREHFARKELARSEKQDLATLVKEAGYEVPPANEIADKVIERHVGQAPPPAPVVDEEEAKAPVRNVWEEHGETPDEWDYEVEKLNRRNGRPYVIHYDEQGESGYETTTFTYYAGDDVLCDERDKIVDDRNVLIGDENLDKFGHGSNDPVIVYIRNDEIAAEFEVVKSEKTYAQEVHGLEHSDSSYPRRRRKFDDE